MTPQPLQRFEFDAEHLIKTHPPRWTHPNKQAVFQIASNTAYPFAGRLIFCRWPAARLPTRVTTRSRLQMMTSTFQYPAEASADVQWHMNFADTELFVAYSSPLLAQDELQVAEHPILGSLREALDEEGLSPETVDEDGLPTPVTISGVQRRCAIDTLPNPGAGRPRGLYGNLFAHASGTDVLAATRPVVPPTISNILAIAAPEPGYGEYSKDEILYVTIAAYTGFLAASVQSAELREVACATRVHTGFWGCGAFGGNRILMTMLQFLAADLAGVDLLFYGVDHSGVALASDARRRYAAMLDATSSVSDIIQVLRNH
jgi:hypothetical protein